MALETTEALEVVASLLNSLSNAMQEDSADGKTITKGELMEIAVAFVKDLGGEVLD